MDDFNSKESPGRALNQQEVCERLGISRPTFYRKIESGEIKHFRVGRSIRVPESWIADLMAGVSA